jgi:signal peptidase I
VNNPRFSKLRYASRDTLGQRDTVVATDHSMQELKSEISNAKVEITAFLKSVTIILVAAFSIRATTIELFKIPSSSMMQTLQIGDFILVLKFWYGLQLPWVPRSPLMWNEPERGDVVVFTRPDEARTPAEDESSIYLIKRVIGLPGDTVEVRGAQVVINGQPLAEPYARWVDGGSPQGDFGPKTVPQGHVLLLGDNRDQSKDSRFWENPFLDTRRIKGKAVLVVFSWDSLSRIGKKIA